MNDIFVNIYGWYLSLYAHFLIPSLLPRCLWYAILRINWGLWSCASFNSVFWERGPAPGKTNMPTDTKLWHAHAQSRRSILYLIPPEPQRVSQHSYSHSQSLQYIMTKVSQWCWMRQGALWSCWTMDVSLLRLVKKPGIIHTYQTANEVDQKTWCALVTGCSCQPLRQSRHWKVFWVHCIAMTATC